MDKSAIRNFAIEARKMLMKSAETEAGFYGVTKNGCKSPIQKGNDFEVYETIAGTENRIYGADIKRRANLVKAVEILGFEQVIEETAYTWFNRIVAIRFMEVNDYLPTRVRVLSSETGSNTPDIVTQSLDVDLNMTPEELEKVQKAKDENRYDDAFRMLFIKQCNELNAILPGLFEKTDDYMELLLKLSYTSDGVVRMLVDSIDENNFNVETEGQVEIIGWMYQYYNSELKDDTFAKLKKNVKISKERIPAATQLFTPDWIVRYMVENSVGRVWIEHLKALDNSLVEQEKAEEYGWNYYLSEAEQEASVAEKLLEIRKPYAELEPKDITCIDPCMGSGHILVYMFEVLMDIYRSEGFGERDAAFSILKYNIHGLDIDQRAYQLSYFALMMKAREYNRTFFRGLIDENGNRIQIEPKVLAIIESNEVNKSQLVYFGANLSEIEKNNAINQINGLLEALKNAKEYGSLLNVDQYDWDLLSAFVEKYDVEGQISFDTYGIYETQVLLKRLIAQGKLMSNRYWIVSTNPPYMGCRKGMNPILKKYVEKNYPESKSDLYSCFIDRCINMIKENGLVSMITQQSFMFTDDYKELRSKMMKNVYFVNMAHLGADAFPEINGEVVQTTAFVVGKSTNVKNIYKGVFSRLLNYPCDDKKDELKNSKNLYLCTMETYGNVKATPFSYWLSDSMRKTFDSKKTFEECGNPRAGITTGDNDSFLRLWFEVENGNVEFSGDSVETFHKTGKKYIPYNKGGEKVKWYGNRDYVIMFDKKHYDILSNQGNHLPSRQYYMRECITWSDISGRSFAARYCPKGSVFDVKGSCGFPNDKDFWFSIALLNCNLTPLYIDSLNPTTTTQVGDLKRIPILPMNEQIKNEVELLARECVRLAKEDWDLDETSWDFSRNTLIRTGIDSVEEAYRLYEEECQNRYDTLINNEYSLNQLFIDAYGLTEEVSPSVNLSEVKLRKANRHDAIVSLISYAVGCMLGRYSLDIDGIAYAGGERNQNIYSSIVPDIDGIIPITDTDYFNDDIVSKFVEFVKVVYGESNLEKNLAFIADSLGIRGTSSREILRNYFINSFYKDHCNIYSVMGSGKRPIYWMFDSGKENGFKCLIYMHRYNKDTLNLIRSEYLHKTEDAVENALKNAEYIIQTSASAVERAKATKDRDRYVKQLNEMRIYYQALSHLALQKIEIDLDDGVKHNYQLFQGVEVIADGGKKQKVDLLAKI